jgi:hypothetical protein
MMIAMIISVLFVALAGLAVFKYAIKHAASGYEDEYGFHEGLDPQRAMDFAARMHTAVAVQGASPAKLGRRTRRILKRLSRKPISQDSAAPFAT